LRTTFQNHLPRRSSHFWLHFGLQEICHILEISHYEMISIFGKRTLHTLRTWGKHGGDAAASNGPRRVWIWNDKSKQWIPDGPQNTPYPRFDGVADGAVYREEPIGPDPYAQTEMLANGTIIDYPALIHVMDRVAVGEVVKPAVWRQMREDLSMAITLPNKSHPAHGSNFNQNQRPEQQIVDWANVITGELKQKLAKFFRERYNIYL
jgi:hypothetical protein